MSRPPNVAISRTTPSRAGRGDPLSRARVEGLAAAGKVSIIAHRAKDGSHRGRSSDLPTDEGDEPRRQVGVLPIRRGRDGAVKVLLVTSRESRRWVIPKGWPMKGRKPFEAAAQEAYEEAGLRGVVGKRPLGYYLYEKRLKNLEAVTCQVKVFPLRVRKQLKHFPEVNQRELRWFTPTEAAESVKEPGLAAIIRAALNRPGATEMAQKASPPLPSGI